LNVKLVDASRNQKVKSLYVKMKFDVLNTMNSLMACDTVLCGREKPMLWTNLFTVTLQIKTAISSDTLTYGATPQKTLLLKLASRLTENRPGLNCVNVLLQGLVFSYPTLVTSLLPPYLHCAYTRVRNVKTTIVNEKKIIKKQQTTRDDRRRTWKG
jgi:hypothetical protein